MRSGIATFEALGGYPQLTGAQLSSVPLDEKFVHDLDSMLVESDSSTTLIYICKPNNPTASLTPRKDLEGFIAKLPLNTVVLIDEAYHHFATDSPAYASFLDHPIDDERILVARTFSKVYDLAGARVGYAIGAPKLVRLLAPYMTQDHMNQFGVHAATAALEDTSSIREFVRRNSEVRQQFSNDAIARGRKRIRSYANFAMLDTQRRAREAIERFRTNKILMGGSFRRWARICVSLSAQPMK
jgi:histidinol-phosphate aminotransferase